MKVTLILLAAFVAAASAAAQRTPRVHEGYSAVQLQQQAQQQQEQQEAPQTHEIDRQQRLTDQQQLNQAFGDLQQGGAGGSSGRFPGGRFPYLPGAGIGGAGGVPGGLSGDSNIPGAAGGNSRESDRRQAYYDPYSQQLAAGRVPIGFQPQQQHPPASYQFGYSVNDPDSQVHHDRHEVRDGDRVTGFYSYVDPTGSLVKVTYEADAVNGYRARVETQPRVVQIRPENDYTSGTAQILRGTRGHLRGQPALAPSPLPAVVAASVAPPVPGLFIGQQPIGLFPSQPIGPIYRYDKASYRSSDRKDQKNTASNLGDNRGQRNDEVLYNQGIGSLGYGSSLYGRTAGLGGLGGYGGLGGLGGYGGLGGLGGYSGLGGLGGIGGYGGLGGLGGLGLGGGLGYGGLGGGLGYGGLGGGLGGLGGIGGLYGGLGGLGGYGGGYGANSLYSAYGNTLYGSPLAGGLGSAYGGLGGIYGSGGLYSGRALYNGLTGYGYKRRSQKDKKKRDDARSGGESVDLTAAFDAADEPTFLDGPHGGPGFGAGGAGAAGQPLQFTGSGPIGAGPGPGNFGPRPPFSPISAPRGETNGHQVRY